MDFPDRVSVLGSVKGQTFTEWKWQFRTALTMKDPTLWWALMGKLEERTPPPHPPPNGKDGKPDPSESWQHSIRLQDRERLLSETRMKALGHLALALPMHARPLMDDKTDPAEAWKAVESTYSEVYRKDVYEVIHKRRTFRQAPNEKASNFITRFWELAAELQEISTYSARSRRPFTAEDKWDLLIGSLNHQNHDIAIMFEMQVSAEEKKHRPGPDGGAFDMFLEQQIQRLTASLVSSEEERRGEERTNQRKR